MPAGITWRSGICWPLASPIVPTPHSAGPGQDSPGRRLGTSTLTGRKWGSPTGGRHPSCVSTMCWSRRPVPRCTRPGQSGRRAPITTRYWPSSNSDRWRYRCPGVGIGDQWRPSSRRSGAPRRGAELAGQTCRAASCLACPGHRDRNRGRDDRLAWLWFRDESPGRRAMPPGNGPRDPGRDYPGPRHATETGVRLDDAGVLGLDRPRSPARGVRLLNIDRRHPQAVHPRPLGSPGPDRGHRCRSPLAAARHNARCGDHCADTRRRGLGSVRPSSPGCGNRTHLTVVAGHHSYRGDPVLVLCAGPAGHHRHTTGTLRLSRRPCRGRMPGDQAIPRLCSRR